MRRRYITTPLVLATFAAVIIGFWISNSGFGAESVAWDTDCSGDTASADAIQVPHQTAGLSVQQREPCKDIGTALAARRYESAADGGMDAMSIDMNTTGNTATDLGSRQPCARINENNIQDADETAVDMITLDVTATNIPVATAMNAFQFDLAYSAANLKVTAKDVTLMLAATVGSVPFDASDSVPDTDGSFTGSAADIAGEKTESGSGVLARLGIASTDTAVASQYDLTLSFAGHVDAGSTGYPPDALESGAISINQACSGDGTPTPTATGGPTPTPTPIGQTPTPTSSGTPPTELTQGDVDCNGNVTSVDALKELRHVALLSVSQTEPCPDIGTDVASLWGDVDCSGSVTSVDALKILRYVALLAVSQTEPCPDIGTPES